ncbi:MAG: leucyl aminopeptidase, partial [bacterium]|nr:leucyl aminopeptidase [bacterium]
ENFLGKKDQVLIVNAVNDKKWQYSALIGLGEKVQNKLDIFRQFGAQSFSLANQKRIKSLTVILPKDDDFSADILLAASAEGLFLARYRFDKYITKDKPEIFIEEVRFAFKDSVKNSKEIISRAQAIAESVCFARDLINEGPWAVNPPALAKMAVKEGKNLDLEVKVLDQKELKKENMNLILAVANASAETVPPCLIKIAYKPKKFKKHVVLVGKGVTFDSGGLDLKPADGMLDMKVDMSGAAAVFGTLLAVAKLKPDVAVTGYLSCVENGIGPKAYHPGDVIKSRKGVTVEINNTDAEGRLVLADALDYAQEQDKPSYLIDLATLTGACMIALGPKTAALFSNNDKLAQKLSDAGIKSGEDYWRLPLNEGLRDQLKSQVADMKNTGTRYGGSITAALFLKTFIHDDVPWAHLDIAGPATSDSEQGYIAKGGVGFGVRTLVEFICELE